MQEPEDTHPEARHRTAPHEAMAPHPPAHDMTQKSVTAESPKAHKKGKQKNAAEIAANAPKDGSYMFIV